VRERAGRARRASDQVEVAARALVFTLVGRASGRSRGACGRDSLAQLGVLLDEYALTINLAPAELRKSGAALDVAIAVAVLGALERLPTSALDNVLFLGELSLDGRLRPIRGVLPLLDGARVRGVERAIVPAGNAREAGLLGGIEVLVAEDLERVFRYLADERPLPRAPRTSRAAAAHAHGDLSEVRGRTPRAARSKSRRPGVTPASSGRRAVARRCSPGSARSCRRSASRAIETTAIRQQEG
jgi:magnesium chelatase family protein